MLLQVCLVVPARCTLQGVGQGEETRGRGWGRGRRQEAGGGAGGGDKRQEVGQGRRQEAGGGAGEETMSWVGEGSVLMIEHRQVGAPGRHQWHSGVGLKVYEDRIDGTILR